MSQDKQVWQESLILDLITKIKEAYCSGQTSYFDGLFDDIYEDFQKVGNVDDLKAYNSTVVHAADLIVQNAMGFVMVVTTAMMGIILALTFRLDERKIQ